MKIIDDLRKRFREATGEQIGRERDRLSDELVGLKTLILREDAHREVDETLAVERERFRATLADYVGSMRLPGNIRRELLNELAAGWATSTPGFAEAAHAAIDADPRYDDMPAAERAAKVDQLTREIASCSAELELREYDQQAEEREVRLKARLTEIASKASGGKDAA